MQPLEIRKYPARILRIRCAPIAEITEKEKYLFENMLFAMKQCSGIGLAGPQVGVTQRLIVADIGQGSVCLANPEIIEVKGKDKLEEGCLSVPGALVKIVRPYEAIVKGLNQKGEILEIKAKGLLARVLLHEIDHLNGKLIVDYMNFLEKIKYKLDRINKREISQDGQDKAGINQCIG